MIAAVSSEGFQKSLAPLKLHRERQILEQDTHMLRVIRMSSTFGKML